MAFLQDDDEDQPLNPTAGQSLQLNYGATGAITGQGTGSSSAGSGRFTNLQKYLQANKETTKNVGAGTQIRQQTESKQQAGQQKLQTEAASTAQAQEAGRALAYDPSLRTQAASAATAEEIQPVASALEARRDTQFKGPTQLSGQAELSQKQAELQDTGKLSSTESGRFALLKSAFGSPKYNRGQQRLDQLLVQGSPDQLKSVKDTRKLAGQFTRSYLDTKEQAGQRSQQLGKEAEETRAKTLEDILGAGGDIEQRLSEAASQFNTEEARRAALKGDIDANRADLGLDFSRDYRAAGTDTPGVAELKSYATNPELAIALIRRYGTYNAAQANIQNVDPSRLGAMNVLRRLAGQEELAAGTKATSGTYGVNIAEPAQAAISDTMSFLQRAQEDEARLQGGQVENFYSAITGSGLTGADREERLQILDRLAPGTQNQLGAIQEVIYARMLPNGYNVKNPIDQARKAEVDAIVADNQKSFLAGQMQLAQDRLEASKQNAIQDLIKRINEGT